MVGAGDAAVKDPDIWVPVIDEKIKDVGWEVGVVFGGAVTVILYSSAWPDPAPVWHAEVEYPDRLLITRILVLPTFAIQGTVIEEEILQLVQLTIEPML